MKKTIIIIAILLIAIVSFVLISQNLNPTGKAIEEEYYTYTKAICNESNYCQDFIISCDGNKTLEIKSITGAAIQHSRSWQDPRTKEQIEKSCD